MKKISTFLGPVFTTIISLAVTFLYFAGLVHSFKKHSTKDFIASVALPPFTIYRGAEMFWHKDKTIKTKATTAYLNEGIQTAVNLIMSTKSLYDGQPDPDFLKSRTEFQEILKKLNQPDLKYMKEGTISFIDYVASVQYDLIEATENLKKSKEFKFHQSEKSLALGKKCSSHGLELEIIKMKNQMEQIESGFQESLIQGQVSNDSELLNTNNMKAEFDQQIGELRSVCEDLFNIDNA